MELDSIYLVAIFNLWIWCVNKDNNGISSICALPLDSFTKQISLSRIRTLILVCCFKVCQWFEQKSLKFNKKINYILFVSACSLPFVERKESYFCFLFIVFRKLPPQHCYYWPCFLMHVPNHIQYQMNYLLHRYFL